MKKVRVAQCWDDGVFTDIRLTGILRKYHAKATFNLCSGLTGDSTEESYWFPHAKGNPRIYGNYPAMRSFYAGRIGKDRLREVYSEFEVASHCDMHENALTTEPGLFLESALKSRRFLEEIFQKECRGFAWPYGTHTDETVQLLADAGFAYGRTTEVTDDVSSCTSSPLKLATSCHFMDHRFWQKYDAAKEGSGVFYFWGHSFEMMDIEQFWKNFDFIISVISNDPEAEWVNVIDLVQ